MDEIALSIETYLAKDLGDSVWENFKKGKLKDSIKEELKNTKLGDDK